MNKIKRSLPLLALALFSAPSLHAKVVLPAFMTDSMVVQQRSMLTLQGRAARGTVVVTPSWNGRDYTAAVDEAGRFVLQLPTPKAGGPYRLTLRDKDGALTLNDLYAGEVWVCSGQSNMEMPVGGWGKVMNYEAEIAAARYPDIRLLQVKKQTAFTPQDDLEVNMGGWRTCSPATVAEFSSIAYFFARTMTAELGVKVGVIDTSWGGTPAEAWTSLGGVRTIKGFEDPVGLLERSKGDASFIHTGYEAQLASWMKLTETADPDFDKGAYHAEWATMPVPMEWEKSVLGEFDGIVWMQQRFTVTPEMAGRDLTLSLQMIDDEDVTYFNGEVVARGSGFDRPRTYTVPARLVKEGEAVITVRVSDFGGGGGIWGDKARMFARNEGGSVSLAGDWRYRVAADFSLLPAKPASPDGSSFPTVLYNAMVHPLRVLPIKGVLWYQGCANVGRDEQYAPLFRRLIEDWRTLWNNAELPFNFVQLAGYLQPKSVQPESQWAALRAAQAGALALSRTAMAVAIDIGNPNDIHPKNKQEVARRLALIALRDSYGRKKVVASAPRPVACTIEGTKAVLTFDNTLATVDGKAPRGFIAETTDGRWIRPEVTQTGKKVLTLQAPQPLKSVRYDWADYPDGNLVGLTGLPVAPYNSLTE